MPSAERLSSKFHICPRSEIFIFRTISQPRAFFPIYQPPEGVYLLIRRDLGTVSTVNVRPSFSLSNFSKSLPGFRSVHTSGKYASSEIAKGRKTVGREKGRGPESIFSNTSILPLLENPFLWSKCQMSIVSPSPHAVLAQLLRSALEP